MQITKQIRDRFWARVKKTTTCWLYGNGPVTRYPYLYGQHEYIRANRLSWRIHRGQIPQYLFVCHKCDTPKCVRPSHLFLGTCQDNVDDMHAKRRNQRGDGAYRNARLTAKDIAAIRGSSEKIIVLARRYGVTDGHISEIKTGKTWRHIKEGIRAKKFPPNNSKLSPTQALEIRGSTEPGLVVAARYGISRPMVYAIRKRRRWGHLTG